MARTTAKSRNASHARAGQREFLLTSIDIFLHSQSVDQYGITVLNRLRDGSGRDDRVPEAFAAVAANDISKSISILSSCIDADQHKRMFLVQLEKEASFLRNVKGLLGAAEALNNFLDTEIQVRGEEPLSDAKDKLATEPLAEHIFVHGFVKEEIQKYFNYAVYLIKLRRDLATENRLRLGATQKSRTEKDAVTAALGWFSEAVTHIAKKPLYAKAAVIAEIALDVEEISVERIREAKRTRSRVWRLNHASEELHPI